ncbi:MAG: ATP-dependent RecD-like DNA helicase, partial [Clostridia bacterium]|nr:ATP-dependent RecD-like DNA helicase [Clostridia bacterium]
MSDNITTVKGTVEKITYKNETNGYTVAEVKSDKEFITVVGILPFLNEGDTAEFFGNFTVHSTYGQQFSATAYERKIPENAAAILRYLSAGAIKGIGPATAGKIVEKFGEGTLDIIQNNPK